MGHPNDIQAALKPLRNWKKIEIHPYGHFRISWIIYSDEPARPGPIVTIFDGLFLGKYKRYGREIFDTNFIQVFNLCYQNLKSMSLIDIDDTGSKFQVPISYTFREVSRQIALLLGSVGQGWAGSGRSKFSNFKFSFNLYRFFKHFRAAWMSSRRPMHNC